MSNEEKVTIEELEQLLGESDKHVDIRPNGEIFVIDYKEKIEQLEAELAKHRWIPVEEGLPERDCFCDIYIPKFNKNCPQRGWYNEHKKSWLTTTKGWGITRQVTHWKPIILPEQEKGR